MLIVCIQNHYSLKIIGLIWGNGGLSHLKHKGKKSYALSKVQKHLVLHKRYVLGKKMAFKVMSVSESY